MAYSKQWIKLSEEEKKLKRIGYRKKYEEKHPERVKENDKRYRVKHRERINNAKKNWQKIKNRQNKLKAIEYLGGHCTDCKKKFPPYVYDFHHLDPKIKEFNIPQLMGRKWENIIFELDKCILLCANCHRIRENKKDYK